MIKSLTSLRGIFILFIFFHHCLDLYPGGGSMAVAFFFVLGGFAMTLGYKDRVCNPGFNYVMYLTRRCAKFFPLHWICIIITLPLMLLQPRLLYAPLFLINALLLHSWIPISDVYFSYNWVSWYLADTMFFAVISPFLLRWILGASVRGRTLIALSFAAAYALVVILVPQQFHHAILYISPYIRLTDFVFGIYLALLFLRLKEKPAKWWNGTVISPMLIFTFIALLVVESCILSEEARLIAPVYWVLIGVVILVTSLSGRIGGGRIYLKTRCCNV